MTENSARAAGGATVAQLKADIDAGRTGDKVSNADPGLSPLGTDDEAAGHPASPERVAQARQAEARIGAQAGSPVRDSVRPKGASIGLMVGVVVVIALVIVAVVLFR